MKCLCQRALVLYMSNKTLGSQPVCQVLVIITLGLPVQVRRVILFTVQMAFWHIVAWITFLITGVFVFLDLDQRSIYLYFTQWLAICHRQDMIHSMPYCFSTSILCCSCCKLLKGRYYSNKCFGLNVPSNIPLSIQLLKKWFEILPTSKIFFNITLWRHILVQTETQSDIWDGCFLWPQVI